jgi:gamma-glutamyltranspeptidase/glutathione hydrolase
VLPLLLLVLAPAAAPAQAPAAPLRVREGLVASQSRIASEAGAAILRRGGNAVDAAVGTALALAVTYPAAGNIGGGGFLVVLLPDGSATSFDFREQAPRAASAEMFLGKDGAYDPRLHHRSHLAAGVPGSVAGLHLAQRRLGKLPWKEVVEPAVALAARGFPVSRGLADSLRKLIDDFRKHPPTLAQFTRGGEPYQEGDVLVQPDLAVSLERVRDLGPDGFYRGPTAELIVAEMERGGGLITLEDLASYRAVERPPVRGSYRGYEVISMGPPSSGGIALIQMLNLLEGYDLRSLGWRSAAEAHIIIESMRRAFADRALHAGDPDFVEVPAARLTSKSYAAELRRGIDPRRASRSTPERFEWPALGGETTHLSVVDAARMAVALTTTLEQHYGLRIIVPGAGFLLNNEMGDFNPRPGLTTEDGLIGTSPNLAAPRKRMLSSMAPTILARDGKPVLVVGSPGGRTIINTVLQVIINFADQGMAVQEAIDAPRFHHQWLPDAVEAERHAFSPDTLRLLEGMGHKVSWRDEPQGSAMGIALTAQGELEAGVDRRRPDGGAVGY